MAHIGIVELAAREHGLLVDLLPELGGVDEGVGAGDGEGDERGAGDAKEGERRILDAATPREEDQRDQDRSKEGQRADFGGHCQPEGDADEEATAPTAPDGRQQFKRLYRAVVGLAVHGGEHAITALDQSHAGEEGQHDKEREQCIDGVEVRDLYVKGDHGDEGSG